MSAPEWSPEREMYEAQGDDELVFRRDYLNGTIARLVEERNLVAEIHRLRVWSRALEAMKKAGKGAGSLTFDDDGNVVAPVEDETP